MYFNIVLITCSSLAGQFRCEDRQIWNEIGTCMKILEGSKPATLDLWRSDFGIFRSLVDAVPWKAFLKGKKVQESWMSFKKEILKAQELDDPMCQKISEWRLSWLNREFWLECRGKNNREGWWPLENGIANSGVLQRRHEVMQGENWWVKS